MTTSGVPLTFAETRPVVLVASAKAAVRDDITRALGAANWRTLEARGGAEALAAVEESGCQVLLLDNDLPDLDAEEVYTLVQARYPGLEIVMLDGRGLPAIADETTSRAATEVIRLLSSGTDAEPLPLRKLPVNAAGIPAAPDVERLPGMVGNSPEMRRVYEMVRLVAPRTTPVLITGSTGSGKELVARALHALSPRAHKPLVTINCAAIPETLLESELFGYARGAFTGAVQSRVGRIHAAHGGTLFLDEIGEMPLSLQPKLLRFLEDGEVQRLGSSDVFKVDVRVVAATNVNLERSVRSNTFREDLFYRLSVFPIPLPALVQRTGDLVPIAEHFLKQLCPHSVRLSTAAIDRLRQHSWPGNVRELRHVMERAAILAQDSIVIGPEHILISSQWQATA